jgi:hypothetical protein
MGLGLGNTLSRSIYPYDSGITKAVLFDGTDDIVTVSDDDSLSFTLSTKIGISVWLNLDSGQSHGIVNKDEEYNLFINSNGGITWIVVDDSEDARKRRATGSGVFTFGQWNHLYVALELEGSNPTAAKVYYNNTAQGSGTHDADFVEIENTAANLLIGKASSAFGGDMGTPNTFAKGKIANLALFEGSLTSTERTNVYNAGRTGVFTDYADNTLRAYYKFSNNFKDSSSNSNTGTASGTSFVGI